MKNRLILISIMILILGFTNISCESSNEQEKEKTDTTDVQKVTFIELGSKDCIPCKMMQPVMDEIEHEFSQNIKVIFHDVKTKSGTQIGKKYKIRVIPTQIFLDKQGEEFFRHEGFLAKEKIQEILLKHKIVPDTAENKNE